MDGEALVKWTRRIIESYFSGEDIEPDIEGYAGVFVTLTKNGELRGCIGIPFPMELKQALKEAALGAINDPRFPPVTPDELDDICIEVSVLTPPEAVENPLKEIEVGKHGVIIQWGPYSGLLLPQVPVEYNWGLEEFLDNACLKAGLPPGFWKNRDVKIYRFEARIFKEVEPGGKVVERDLKGEMKKYEE